MSTGSRLPLYTCHKQVRAAKINDVLDDETLVLNIDGELVSQHVGVDWVMRQEKARMSAPKPYPRLEGGYYVEYADGYTSWSPPSEFEAGYLRNTP